MTSKALTTVLSVMIKKSTDIEAVVSEFWKYCEERNLLYKTPFVIRRLESLAEKENIRKTLRISSPFSISDKVVEEIALRVHASRGVHIEKEVDSTLIGGFVAQYDDRIYDGSVLSQIKKLREALVKN